MSKLYLYETGQVLNGLEILEQKRVSRKRNGETAYEKGYLVRCLVYDYIYDTYETHLARGNGCKLCNGNHLIVKGINDVATTHPDIVKYFVNIEDAYNYSHGSEKYILFKCLDCGSTKSMKIGNLKNKGFSCDKCSDGVSYPNKFMFNILEQLGIDFIPEYSPEWIKPKRYDFYFKLNNAEYITEMDGGFHNIDNHMTGITKEDSKMNDNFKDEIAKQNNISVIRIDSDCGKIDNELHLRTNILKSELPIILGFKEEDIDWLKCHEFSISSRIKEACDLWNQGIENTKEIARIMKMDASTVCLYLKRGAKINLCNYSPEKCQHDARVKSGKLKGKRVRIIETGEEFNSIVDLVKIYNEKYGIKFTKGTVSQVCREERPHHKGYHFEYI